MRQVYFHGSRGFDLYVVDSDGHLVSHGTFPTLDDAVDGAVDANLPAARMCIVQRDIGMPHLIAVRPSWIPPVEVGMSPAVR